MTALYGPSHSTSSVSEWGNKATQPNWTEIEVYTTQLLSQYQIAFGTDEAISTADSHSIQRLEDLFKICINLNDLTGYCLLAVCR